MLKEYAVWDQIYWPLGLPDLIIAESRGDALQIAKVRGVCLPIVEEWNDQHAAEVLERIRRLDRKLQGEAA